MEKNYDFQEEELRDVIFKIPDYYTKRIIIFFSILILCAIIACSIIRFPDILISRVNILSTNPSVKIVAPIDGQIKLYKVFNQNVEKNDVIAEIVNSAKLADVLEIENELNLLSTDSIEKWENSFKLSDNFKLGELTDSYSSFLKSFHDYKLLSDINTDSQEVSMLQNRYSQYEDKIASLQESKAIEERKKAILKKKYLTDSILFSKGIITMSKYNGSKLNYIKSIEEIGSVEKEILSFKQEKANITDEVKLKQMTEEKEHLNIDFKLKNSLIFLKNSIKQWKQKYLITAPFSGKLEFLFFFDDDYHAKQNESLFAIVPSSQEFYGQAIVSSNGVGKINSGNIVHIKLNDYPYNEFGYVLGNLESISQISQDSLYVAKISLQNGLNSSIKKQLKFSHNMSGVAEIITEDKLLIERIFEKTINGFK